MNLLNAGQGEAGRKELGVCRPGGREGEGVFGRERGSNLEDDFLLG